jgi:hypothetical protein
MNRKAHILFFPFGFLLCITDLYNAAPRSPQITKCSGIESLTPRPYHNCRYISDTLAGIFTIPPSNKFLILYTTRDARTY